MRNITGISIFMIVLSALLFSYGAYAEDRPEFDDSSVLVVMKSGGNEISLFSADDPFEGLGISKVESLDLHDGGISLFSADDSTETLKLTLSEAGEDNVVSLIETLNSMDEVEYAQPNYYYYLDAIADDMYYINNYQYNLSKIGAEYVWDMNIDAAGIAVAVIDTGMSMEHEDLAENLWTNTKEIAGNGIDDDGNGYIDDVHGWDFAGNDNSPDDKNGHGTHVSGIVSAVTNNGLGVASLARNAKIVPLRIFDDDGGCKTEYIYGAMNYVYKMGFKVANCSWDSTGYDRTLVNAMNKCKDTVFTVAAGNVKTGETQLNIDRTPVYPAAYTLSNIITVSSTNSSDALSSFSNYGKKSVDIAAPGELIYSTDCNSSDYSVKSGTSMAAPLVASAAALVRAQRPDFSVADTINAILEGADTVTGLKNMISSSRRLNAYTTLKNVSPIIEEPEPSYEPMSAPTVSEAETDLNDGVLSVKIEFAGVKPDKEDIMAIVSFRDKESGILLSAVKVEFNDDFTADIHVPDTFIGSDISVYIWNSAMCPLWDVLHV